MPIPRAIPTLLAILFTIASAGGQDNPVYVDASPTALDLLHAADQLAETDPAGAALRLQELLENSAGRVVPVEGGGGNQFQGVRAMVLERLREKPALLEAWRMQWSDAAAAALERNELVNVHKRWELTPAGLTALLYLGHRDIERGAPGRGTERLRRVLLHPDADDQALANARHGLAMAAAMIGDQVALEENKDALASLGSAAEPWLEAIGQWRFEPSPWTSTTIHDTGASSNMEHLVGLSIWSTSLEDSLLARRFGVPNRLARNASEGLQARTESGWYTTSSPTIHGDLVFLNLGRDVIAFDVLTGQEQWHYKHRQADFTLDPNERPNGMNEVAIEGRFIVTIAGINYGDERSSDGAILCLDVETGRLRWSVILDGNPDIPMSNDLFPCSSPVIHEGVAYVMARRLSRQQLVSESLVAIDLVHGEVLWSRWIASSGQLRRNIEQAVSMPLADGDRIHVRTTAGAIASVDAATGDLLWVQRMPPPDPNAFETRMRPYTSLQPVRIPGGLLAHAPDGRTLFMLDPATGEVLDSWSLVSSPSWNEPLYLLSDGTYIFSVGIDLSCFKIDNLDVPLWRHQWIDSEEDIAGRIQILEDSIIIPMQDRLLQVDSATGNIDSELQISRSGNALLAGSQLFVAGPTTLEAYCAFERAETALQDRIESTPESLEPRMDLVRLAARSGNNALLVEAAGNMLDLLEEDPEDETVRDRLLGHLVAAMKRLEPGQEPAGELVAGMMKRTAITASQQLETQLALGDWLYDTVPRAAAEYWLAILMQDEIGDAWHVENNVHAPGSIWARQRLAGIDDLDVSSGPLAEAAGTGSVEEQVAAARWNLRWTPDAQELARQLASTIDLLLEHERFQTARALVIGWQQRHGERPLIGSSGPLAPTDILATIGSMEGIEPSTGNLGEARRIRGRLVHGSPYSRAGITEDLLLIATGEELVAFDQETLQVRWKKPVAMAVESILQQEDGRTALLGAHESGRIELMVMDDATGEHIGGVEDVGAEFPPLEAGAAIRQSIRPSGHLIEPDELLVAAESDMISFIRSDGQVRILTDPGGVPEWRHASLPLRVVHDLLPWPGGFMAVGPDPVADHPLAVSNANPVVYFVDTRSLDVQRVQWPGEIGDVRWLARSPLDDLVLGGDRGIAAVGWPGQRAEWLNTSPDLLDTQYAWASGNSLVVLDAADELLDVSLAHGRIEGLLENPVHRDNGVAIQMDVRPGGFTLLREGGMAVHDADGVLIGADSIPGDLEHELLLEHEDGWLLLTYLQSITHLPGTGSPQGRRHLYRVHMLDRQGRLLDLFDLYPLDSRIRAARSSGTYLILETAEFVDLVPLPDWTVQ